MRDDLLEAAREQRREQARNHEEMREANRRTAAEVDRHVGLYR